MGKIIFSFLFSCLMLNSLVILAGKGEVEDKDSITHTAEADLIRVNGNIVIKWNESNSTLSSYKEKKDELFKTAGDDKGKGIELRIKDKDKQVQDCQRQRKTED